MTQQYQAKLLALIILLFSFLPATSLAAGEPRLLLAADSLPVAVGQELEVKLVVEDASPTIKVETHLTFNPNALQVVTVEHGDFLTGAPETEALVLQNQFDNEAGVIDYALLLKPDQAAVEGNGLVATITFQARQDGPATIAIQEAFLFDPTGVKIVAQTDSIELTIGDEAAAEFALESQVQTEFEQTASTINNPEDTQAISITPRQIPQSTTPTVTNQPTVTEPEELAELNRTSQTAPRRFQSHIKSNANHNRLLALIVIAAPGVIVLFIGTMGLIGLMGSWFWLQQR